MYEWKVAVADKDADALTKLLNDMEAEGWAPADAPWQPGVRRDGETWIRTVLITFVREAAPPVDPDAAPPEDAEPPAGTAPQDAILYHLDAAFRALGQVPRRSDQKHAQARELINKSLQMMRSGVLKVMQEGHL